VGSGQFRFSYCTQDYDATVAFYRDGLVFPVVESWDRDPEYRGTLFGAASGLVESLKRPESGNSSHLWDIRPPQGAFMVIEVEDVDKTYRQWSKKASRFSRN
jgi:catechol 2,3-dioxygenase-like lactoylglutathione lyase family enzyme